VYWPQDGGGGNSSETGIYIRGRVKGGGCNEDELWEGGANVGRERKCAEVGK
jgi:hypothetical protein